MGTWNVSRYDYYTDHLDQNLEFWSHLRTHDPVVEVETHGGYFLVSRYRHVDEVHRDTKRFVSRFGTAISSGPNLEELPNPMLPLESDPPETGKYRKLVSEAMARGPMESRSEEARDIAVELFDEIGSDRFDFVEAFADPYPREVTMRAIGFELSELEHVRPWLRAQANLPRDDPDYLAARVAGDEYLMEYIGRRRQGEPTTDLAGRVIFGTIDGRPMTDQEASSMLKNLLMGALGTTTKTLTEAAYIFSTQPDIAHALRADPGLWSTAVDEILRYTSVIHGYGRTVAEDTSLGGCPMKRGDRVRPILASANRDPEVFDRPDELLLDRSPNRHLAFGQGAHKCVGQHLARVMIRVALTTLLERYEDIRLDDEVPLRRYAMESASAFENMPLRVVPKKP